MKLFLYKNRLKLATILIIGLLMVGLTSCRTSADYWYSNVYTTWGAEFHFQGFWDGFWGWPVSILSYPFAWLCSNIGKGLGNSYIWGIVFTTIIIRTVAWPIYSKQNGVSVKMQIMQPELDKLQKKYAFRKDEASQQKMRQEMMAIYKKYKFNPLGCIFTMFIQFPIFVAMYEVVRRINLTQVVDAGNGVLVESFGKFALADTKLFGFFELNGTSAMEGAVQDRILCVVIALLYAGITFLSQKLAQRKPSYVKKTSYNTKQNDQARQMKIMNIVMIVMFFFIALSSTALGIYWLIGAIYQIFQSYIGRKMNERTYYKHQRLQAAGVNVIEHKTSLTDKVKSVFNRKNNKKATKEEKESAGNEKTDSSDR